MKECSNHIQQTHIHIWLSMTDERKVIVFYQMVTGGKKNEHITPIQMNQETDSRHIMSDGRLDCITKNDTHANTIRKNTQSS